MPKHLTISLQALVDRLRHGNDFGVFIDDSGTPRSPDGMLAVHPEGKTWVALVLPPEMVVEVVSEMPGALAELQTQTGASEFHFSDIFNGRRQFRNVSIEGRLSIFSSMATILSHYDFDVLVQTLDPTSLASIRSKCEFPDLFFMFDLRKVADASLFFLLYKIKHTIRNKRACPAQLGVVFADEGFKKRGTSICIEPWKDVFEQGLVSFCDSAKMIPLQLADFAAFCLNRTQLLLGRGTLSSVDERFLEAVRPLLSHFRDLPIINIRTERQEDGRLSFKFDEA